MKFTVQMKDPDVLHDAIADAVRDLPLPDLSYDEAERVRDLRQETTAKLCSTWFEYGEYLRVEIDTDAKTCTVLPAK